MKLFQIALAALGFALVLQPLPATAQVSGKPTQEEYAGAIRYAMPRALVGLRQSCAAHLRTDGFLARNGAQLQARYSADSRKYWPVAKAVFLKLGLQGGKDETQMLAMLPDEALEPFVSALIPGMVGDKIKPSECQSAESLIEQLAPLPTANLAKVAAIFMVMSDKSNAEKLAGNARAKVSKK